MPTTTRTSDCCEFVPSHSRPNKCRNCFGDMSQHNIATSRQDASSRSATTSPDELASTTTTTSTNDAGNNIKTNEKTTMECKQCCQRQAEIDRLKNELEEWQQRCRLAEEQSQRARDELQSLESEMEELHDNFKEEENEQFEQVKQELDACLKNCKILQIRLNKSERQYNQLEQVKQMLERQLQERLMPVADSGGDIELNQCDSQSRSGSDWRQRQQQQHGSEPFARTFEVTQSGQAEGDEFVKVPASEYDQMLRDLNDTSERERDLQEQIKYSQEEAQLKGERLQAIEAENEILLGRINKLTLANSSLRSSTMLSTNMQQTQEPKQSNRDSNQTTADMKKLRELCEQNEQLKLALELAQSEAERLRSRIQESNRMLEAREEALKEAETKVQRLAMDQEDEKRDHLQQQQQQQQHQAPRASSRLELECRQLRARLVHSERECRQLRSQLECFSQAPANSQRRPTVGANFRSHSLESPTVSGGGGSSCCSSSKCQENMRQLERQCKSLIERNNQLEVKLQKLVEMSSESLEQRTSMESELMEKLKLQLDSSESELAKARSRLVELDIECGRAQRQYKRLLNSLETCGSAGGEFQLLRRNKLPSESARDSLSRQELRQAVRDLELDLDDLMTIIRAKECYIKERSIGAWHTGRAAGSSPSPASGFGSSQEESRPATGDRDNEQQQHKQQTSEQQVKSLRRLLDQEQLLSNNLKLDVANLEQDNQELKMRRQVLERERVAMEEELDKLRQVLGELRAELEESEGEKARAQNKNRELNETLERLKLELESSRQLAATKRGGNISQEQEHVSNTTTTSNQDCVSKQQQTDMLVAARDLSELKVKNGFLMRQLELAREDAARQLDELRSSCQAQQKRAVELAQIELKERHLQEGQQLRDELNDLKQKLAQTSRQAARQEEETNLERDRARAVERDWRREKSQWQQVREQLEGQLAIEKRSSEFRLKEAEAAIRDKERSLMSVQDRCVQLERDLKRMQNKFHLLEENNESKIKQLARDLEMRTKDLNEITRHKRMLEEQQYETVKRLNDEKSTLKETLETIRRSYDEKLAEARQLREVLQSRQEQAYKERTQLVERVEALTRRLNELSDQESQAKLLKQRLEIQERQLESVRRELSSMKEERTKLRDRCDELEKRELISKTSSISGLAPSYHHHHHQSGSSSFLRPFSSKAQLVGRATNGPQSANQNKTSSAASMVEQTQTSAPVAPGSSGTGESQQLQLVIEKLSGKINDQRNLINILRQQWSETQMELKQVKLLQASERSKWQTNVALLTGRLNECEEKLAYETLVLQGNPALIDQLARPKLDSSWTLERKTNLDLIKQQQTQIELLTRDLKKISQAHELLRLHSKQLETHNNKLSKKLIEFQQHNSLVSQQDGRLEGRYERLLKRHSRLVEEMRPLIEIVSKIVGSLDAPEQASPGSSSGTTTRIGRVQSDSTERPLRAGVSQAALVSRLDSDESDGANEPVAAVQLSTVIQSSKPAHQMNKTAQQTRLTRLLAGGKLHARDSSSPSPSRAPPGGLVVGVKGHETLSTSTLANQAQSADSAAATITTTPKAGTTKPTRRVRVKCSTLGITTAEKKQLKQQLKKLAEKLDLIDQEDQNEAADELLEKDRAGSARRPVFSSPSLESPAQAVGHSSMQSQHSDSTKQSGNRNHQHQQTTGSLNHDETDQSSQRSQASRVRWQLDSDLESERSWSLEPNSESGRNADIYRRFPQATPSSGRHSFNSTVGTSLTDYESESSANASDYSLSGFTPVRPRHQAPSGAESDSGIATTTKVARKKTTGFKGRLTNTLRNISRSITGLGSDTEDSTSGGPTSSNRGVRSSRRAGSNEPRTTELASSNNAKSQSILKEIRV